MPRCEAEPVRDELCDRLLDKDWLLVPLPLRVNDWLPVQVRDDVSDCDGDVLELLVARALVLCDSDGDAVGLGDWDRLEVPEEDRVSVELRVPDTDAV